MSIIKYRMASPGDTVTIQHFSTRTDYKRNEFPKARVHQKAQEAQTWE